jgi:hypothetical protein
MMLEKVQYNADLIVLAEQVLLRQAVTQERALQCMNLAFAARFRINWRAVLTSVESVGRLWDTLREFDIDYDQLMSMTDEFMFRTSSLNIFTNSPHNSNTVLLDIVRSLTWTSSSKSIPPEVVSFTGKEEQYLTALRTNAWVVFMYLVYMSDGTGHLAKAYPAIAAGIKRSPVEKDAENEATGVSKP